MGGVPRLGAQARCRGGGHHAVDNALAIEDAGEDPDRWLVIGPDRAGNLLEVAVMTTVEGGQLVIHAMPMREKFRRLLER